MKIRIVKKIIGIGLFGFALMVHNSKLFASEPINKIGARCYKKKGISGCERSYEANLTLQVACTQINSEFPNLDMKKLYNHSPDEIEANYPGITKSSAGHGIGVLDTTKCADPTHYFRWKGNGPKDTKEHCLKKYEVACPTGPVDPAVIN